MLEMEEVKIDNALKRIIFDILKDRKSLDNIYPLEILDEKKIRKEVINLLVEKGYVKDTKLHIPKEYKNLYEEFLSKREEISLEKKESLEEEYKRIFSKARKEYLEDKDFTFKYYKENSEKLKKLAAELHYLELPEYTDYLVYNRGVLPEKNLIEFYDHYHSLEYLYEWLENPINEQNKIRQIKGDINLNKELKLEVYSNRWGHLDQYTVVRTLEGWDCRFVSFIKGNKNGDAILNFMKHDGISYPVSLEDDFEELWDQADKQEMSITELQNKINEISTWIIETEQKKPSFLN